MLIGISLPMSIINNRTGELWGTFMPRRHEVSNTVNTDLISMQIYDNTYFKAFNPANTFTKWAGAEVSSFETVPEGMSTIVIPEGMYAVFDYKGSSADSSIFQYIFSEWLPKSGYQLDNRPHFEVLGKNYKNNDPESEEEIWIPIRA